MSKQSYWIHRTVERSGHWTPNIHVARYMNDPANFTDVEVLDVVIVEVTDHAIYLLTRERATDD